MFRSFAMMLAWNWTEPWLLSFITCRCSLRNGTRAIVVVTVASRRIHRVLAIAHCTATDPWFWELGAAASLAMMRRGPLNTSVRHRTRLRGRFYRRCLRNHRLVARTQVPWTSPVRLPNVVRSSRGSDGSTNRINVLFVCSRNQWRSPTAKPVHRDDPRVLGSISRYDAVREADDWSRRSSWAEWSWKWRTTRHRLIADYPARPNSRPSNVCTSETTTNSWTRVGRASPRFRRAIHRKGTTKARRQPAYGLLHQARRR